MDKYKEYLAASVINERNVVTYRLLSRALKVHVHLAKQMLCDFHTKQNDKKPGIVHATYLISGKRRIEQPKPTNGIYSQDGEDGDSIMQSSPPFSSMPEPDKEESDKTDHLVSTMTLATQEDLEDAKAQFEEISCIHVYSLEPGPIQNIQIISACNQQITSKYNTEDPLESYSIYGTIHNPNATRRKPRTQPPPIPTAPAPANASAKANIMFPSKSKDAAPKPARRESTNDETTSQPDSTAKKTDPKKPGIARDKSDIFKSFAKARAQPKKIKSEEASPAPSVEHSTQEDEPMEDASDGENEAEAIKKREEAQAQRKIQQDRQAKLRQMMEESDEEEEEKPAVDADADSPMADAPPPETPKPAPEERPGAEQSVITAGGRRRGRRRVNKKRTLKDEDGYLVTKEELVWESFSEAEPEPKKLKSVPAPSTAKPKKGAKPGQGNIARFFTKKP